MLHNTPPTFDAAKYLVARERMQRRNALWHSARLRLGDEQFFTNLGAVERSVSVQLHREGLG
ncbi:hypothetical protein A3731_10345 [Roseovarius sp. HI0049]|nr:hypothetical protein A3731_10345 [Roseovarius sp. HI0049]